MISKRKKNEERRSIRVRTKPSVYAYSSISKKRDVSSSANLKRESKGPRTGILRRSLRAVLLLSILALVGFLSYTSLDPIIRIEEEQITIKNKEDYYSGAKEAMKNNYFNYSKVLFDYVGFENFMIKKYPEISSVKTSFAIVGDRPVVRLNFYQPAIIVNTSGKTWVVDKRGVIISEYLDRLSDLPRLNDEIGIAVEEGSTVVSSTDVDFVLKIYKAATKEGIKIEEITTPVIPKQLHVRVVGESYYTKFNLDEKADEQIGVWLVARDNLKRIEQMPDEYLDIRAVEKVFWK